MKTYYATFGCGSILSGHILKIYANDERHARSQLFESKLLTSCISFIYDEDKGLEQIDKWKYIVIEGRLI